MFHNAGVTNALAHDLIFVEVSSHTDKNLIFLFNHTTLFLTKGHRNRFCSACEPLHMARRAVWLASYLDLRVNRASLLSKNEVFSCNFSVNNWTIATNFIAMTDIDMFQSGMTLFNTGYREVRRDAWRNEPGESVPAFGVLIKL